MCECACAERDDSDVYVSVVLFMFVALFVTANVCIQLGFYGLFRGGVRRSHYSLGVLLWPQRAVLSSNRDTHCSHLALHGRVETWQRAEEAPSVDTKRSFNII